jgi:hypothetical protein
MAQANPGGSDPIRAGAEARASSQARNNAFGPRPSPATDPDPKQLKVPIQKTPTPGKPGFVSKGNIRPAVNYGHPRENLGPHALKPSASARPQPQAV